MLHKLPAQFANSTFCAVTEPYTSALAHADSDNACLQIVYVLLRRYEHLYEYNLCGANKLNKYSGCPLSSRGRFHADACRLPFNSHSALRRGRAHSECRLRAHVLRCYMATVVPLTRSYRCYRPGGELVYPMRHSEGPVRPAKYSHQPQSFCVTCSRMVFGWWQRHVACSFKLDHFCGAMRVCLCEKIAVVCTRQRKSGGYLATLSIWREPRRRRTALHKYSAYLYACQRHQVHAMAVHVGKLPSIRSNAHCAHLLPLVLLVACQCTTSCS